MKNTSVARNKAGEKSGKIFKPGLLARFFVKGGALITLAVILTIVVYILVNGIPNLNSKLFAWEYNSENVSMMPAIVNTVVMVVVTLLMSVPIGIGAAVYMVEYVKKESKLAKIIKLATQTYISITLLPTPVCTWQLRLLTD